MSVNGTGLPKPTDMIRHVQQFVYGQDDAKRAVTSAVYKHYLDIAARASNSATRPRFGRKHVLLIGPTGCGKTFLLQALSSYLKVPIAFVNATSLVEDGYVGEHIDGILHRLYTRAGRDMNRARCGILFIDEIDKIRRRTSGSDRDVSGEGVQTMLLPLLDGGQFTIDARNDRKLFDTSNLLVIAAGAFVGLSDIIRRRIGAESTFGFTRRSSPELTTDDALREVDNHDLIAFGMIPEFLGRFATVETLAPLDREALQALLTNSKHSAIAAQQAYYRQHGVELTLTSGAIEAVAELAVKSGTHARGAERLLLRSLKAVEWQLPDLAEEGVTRVIVDADVVHGRSAPRVESSPPSETARSAPARELRRVAQALMELSKEQPRPSRTLRRTTYDQVDPDDQMGLPF